MDTNIPRGVPATVGKAPDPCSGVHQEPVATVGMAFLPKKLPRVLTPKLRTLASAAGLRLQALDPHRPLELQATEPDVVQLDAAAAAAAGSGPLLRAAVIPGWQPELPFDLVLHKLHSDAEWEAHLAEYVAHFPKVRVLDSVTAVHATLDRAAMLNAIPPEGLPMSVKVAQQSPSPLAISVHQLQDPEAVAAGASGAAAKVRTVLVCAPPQLLVRTRGELRAVAADARSTGMSPPLVIKTQRADAAGGSGHGLAVALTWDELSDKAELLQGGCATVADTTADDTVTVATGRTASGSGKRKRPDDDEGASGGDGTRGGGGGCVGGGADGSGGGAPWEPLVIQQYVPHNEALYKVYVLGQHVQVERRASLTLTKLTELQRAGAGEAAPAEPALLQHFSRAPMAADAEIAPPTGDAARDDVAAPASREDCGSLDDLVLVAVARELSQRMALTMFNFDVVVPDPNTADGPGARAGPAEVGSAAAAPQSVPEIMLYVVDVNYFPGYDKLPGWEAHLVAHLRMAADAIRTCAPAPVGPTR